MKSKLYLALVLAACASMAAAQQAPSSGTRPLVAVKRQVDPVFPRSLLDLGVTQGEARVVVSIGPDGRVAEMLVIGYTHPAFGQAATNALREWEFEPPTFQGQPASVQREMRFDFESRGVVITMDVSSYVAMRAMSIFSERYVYRPVTLKELDRIPTPLNTVSPLYPQSLIEQKRGGSATVEFFIDEQGNVRMPSVLSADDPDAGVTSVLAVKEWKFEPPTRNGRPVLVKAHQTFRFK
jgi:TonB family protein